MRKLAFLAVPLSLAGCGSGAHSLGPAPKPKQPARSFELGAPAPATSKPKKRDLISVQIWLVQGHGLREFGRARPKTLRVATSAMQELLAGPTQGERRGSAITTAIPRGTRLIGVSIENGVATVDLTSQFQTGGGSESLQLRLAQVVYTLTQFPTVHGVRFELDGAPIDVSSSKGVVVDRPVRRSDYGKPDCAGIPFSKQGFIAINYPRPGARLTRAGHIEQLLGVHGCSSTFEGGLNWDLKTKDGVTVSAGIARGGSLRPAPFRFTVSPPSLGEGAAVLEVYEPPASGEGGPTSRVVVPVVILGPSAG